MLEIMADKSEDHSKMLSKRLGQAIHKDELEHVRMYIEQGVNVNRQCYPKWFPLALACRSGHEEVMEELPKAGGHPNQVSGRRNLPAVFIAAEKRVLTLPMMRCLISHGADVNFRNDHGKTVLHMLARGQFNDADDNLLSAAKLALDSGGSFDARDVRGRTPLYEACRSGNIDLVKLFIAEGADVNIDIAEGADVNFDIGHRSMLTGAADSCNIDMFDLLLNAGANRQLPPDALIYPCLKNDHAMIARIQDTCDVDINIPLDQFNGMTILHYVCENRFITRKTGRLLLDRGADARAVSDSGDTILHYEAMHRDCNKIRHLLTYNVPLNIKNNDNQTPLARLAQEVIIDDYSYSVQQTDTRDQRNFVRNYYQAGLLAFKMLVIAGANVTADVEHNLNQSRLKHPEAQIPNYKITSTRSLKEMCRFVIRSAIPVPVDTSLRRLSIPKLLQEYLNFTEFDQLLDKYNGHY